MADLTVDGSGTITLSGSAIVVATTPIDITLSFDWVTGPQPLRWFQVQGCCRSSTGSSSSSGSGESGTSTASQPSGCEILPFESQDPNCKGLDSQTTFIQTVLAKNVAEVCEQLHANNWHWPICSFKRFSKPAENKYVAEGEVCNKLEDVEYLQVPECLQFTLHTDGLVKMGMEVTDASGVMDVGGTITLSGSAVIVQDSYSYDGSGTIVLSGSGDVVDPSYLGIFETEMGMETFSEGLEAVFNDTESDDLESPTDIIVTQCGECTSMPLTLYVLHNLDKGNIFKQFLIRNDFDLPLAVPIYYSPKSASWQGSLHYTGIADDNRNTEEIWRITFEWSCTDEIASEELGANVWKFAVFANRKNLSTNTDFDTRILMVFPATELCDEQARLGLNFPFQMDTKKNYVYTNLDIVVDVRLLYDNIGLFKSSYWNSNFLRFIVTQNPGEDIVERKDIKPIFPN